MKNLFMAALMAAFMLSVSPSLYANTLTVNSSTDSHDINPGDGICADHALPDSSRCTLRAAIEEANSLVGADTIIIPADSLLIRLSLGPLRLTADSTAIIGLGGFPVIDGVANPYGDSMLVMASNNNLLRGITIRRARSYGVVITGAGNVLGDTTEAGRNQFIGCGLDHDNGAAILVSGSDAFDNRIQGNFVGVYGNGAETYANNNGIRIAHGSHDNLVGGTTLTAGNIISANNGYGVIVTDSAYENTVSGNIIGPDITGAAGIGNGAGGVLMSGDAFDNTIGGQSEQARNLISANRGHGITLTGSNTRGNVIAGNFIGVEHTGWQSLANIGSGVMITEQASDNLIGGFVSEALNVISGNRENGVVLTGWGTSGNTVAGNHIGVSLRGGWLIGGDDVNEYGVVISDGASMNTIGHDSPEGRNTISGNYRAGIYIHGNGTADNRVIGNFIGIGAWGTSSAPNGSGVILRFGTSGNEIGGPASGEGNVISGNRWDVFPFGGGVLIYDPGTDYNIVQGNFIGTDSAGGRALRNGSAGVIIGNGARHNLVGGETAGSGNLISGNGTDAMVTSMGRGVHIYGEGTSFNTVCGNAIGLDITGTLAISNYGHGVGLFDGAQHNVIGGDSPEAGNTIAGNEAHGVCVADSDTYGNSVRYNGFIDNDSLPVMIRNEAQQGVEPPEIQTATTAVVSGQSLYSNATVDIYTIAPDTSGTGEEMVHRAEGMTDSTGQFSVPVSGLIPGDTVSAMITDADGNSSQFAARAIAQPVTDVDDEPELLPTEFSLSQNYPNPFNPSTRISYSLPRPGEVELVIFNTLGQQVARLNSGTAAAGRYEVIWDGTDDSGNDVASGVYLYRLTTPGHTASKKMLLLR